mmetsp:Transcript_11230/g.20476  ORF Transcript_11230/g.20476 Transcript_11230/m.20476 type:complete len:307 (-) Transcript_11230:279-1199(-)
MKIAAAPEWVLLVGLASVGIAAAFAPSRIPQVVPFVSAASIERPAWGTTALWSSADLDDSPSDYDPSDLGPDEKTVTVDTNESDAVIRDALKRELLLLASITDRGEFATPDESDIIVDLVTQLEALNPTAEPAYNCAGEWDLCLTNTQSFRSSPFFMAIRAAVGDDNKAVAENGFDIHERSTSASRVGRVRQKISSSEMVSEVDLEVGLIPGLPILVKGTVVTTADLVTTAQETWEITVKGTKVMGSNVPFLDQYLDDNPIEIPVGDAYSAVTGSVPVATLKTYYVDGGIRITRDVDDNFFVFSRA